ncbi:MAG: DUF167 domain-containing protein [Phycisphaerales bacterium]|nr:DUF167 domain-containing protein [Phycisphaerales bacterium]
MWNHIVQDATDGPGVVIRVKAIPNAKHPGVGGALGDRLKVKVNAPPEGGKANAAICELIAVRLGVKASAVQVVDGATSPEKTVRAEGVSAQDAITLLA